MNTHKERVIREVLGRGGVTAPAIQTILDDPELTEFMFVLCEPSWVETGEDLTKPPHSLF